MGLDESLFGALYRRLAGIFSPALRSHGPIAASFEDHAQRLTTLACLLAGEAVDVRATDEPCGWRGPHLQLPKRVHNRDTEAAVDTLVVALLWSVASRSLDFVVPQHFSPWQAALGTLLVAPAIERALLEQYPGAAPQIERVRSAELAARMELRRPTQAEQALESLARLKLAAKPPAWASPASVAWAMRANRVAPDSSASLCDAVAELSPLLLALGRVRSSPQEIAHFGRLRPRFVAQSAGVSEVPDELGGGAAREQKARRGRLEANSIPEMENAEQDNPAVHSFEKTHTLDDYAGGQKRMDGADELQAHSDALDELELGQVIRSRVQTTSIYQMDALFSGSAPEAQDDAPDSAATFYDEWNESSKSYRREWCRVLSRVPPAAAAEVVLQRLQAVERDYGPVVRLLRAQFERIAKSRVPRSRQLDGPDVDIDATVQYLAQLRAGSASEPKLYISRRRHVPALSVLLLVDASLSTDAWVDNRRVLDVAQDSVIVLSQALEGIFDEVGLAMFFSRTRRDCRFCPAKGFGEHWSAGLARMLSVEPTGYTRIGPAIRHGTARLLETSARQKMLIVLSDGRPTDYDRYEGSYGVADVHQAVSEARANGVTVFGLGIDPRARTPLLAMFGHGYAEVLASPSALPTALARIFVDILR